MWLCHGERCIICHDDAFDRHSFNAKLQKLGEWRWRRWRKTDTNYSAMMAPIFRATQAAIHKHCARFDRRIRLHFIYLLFKFRVGTLPNTNRFRPRAPRVPVETPRMCAATTIDEFSDSHSESLYLFVDSFSAAMFRSTHVTREERRTERMWRTYWIPMPCHDSLSTLGNIDNTKEFIFQLVRARVP